MTDDVPLRSGAATLQRLSDLPRWTLERLAAAFPPHTALCAVVTHGWIDAAPEEAWRRIVFYEDVSHRPPPLLLRVFLPVPLRTSKPGLVPGALVHCSYTGGGHLVKRITDVQPPSLVRFEVIEQHLGIERCVVTAAGSYDIRRCEAGSEIALTTTYRGHLRPRWLWRRAERWMAHALHRHILGGMGAMFGTSELGRSR